MNLHGIASRAIRAVNPMVPVVIQSSTGYTTAADGTRAPTYRTVRTTGQVQALTGRDLRHLELMNVQGVSEKAYLNGNYEGLIRKLGKGGDLLTFALRPGGPTTTYLAMAVLERWPDWCALGLIAQLDATTPPC